MAAAGGGGQRWTTSRILRLYFVMLGVLVPNMLYYVVVDASLVDSRAHLLSLYSYSNFMRLYLHVNWLCTPFLGARGCTPIPEVYPPPQAVPPPLEQERHRLH